MDYPYQYAVLRLDGSGTASCAAQTGVKLDGTQPFTVDAWVRLEDGIVKKTIVSQKDGFSMGIDKNRLFFNMVGYPTVYSSGKNGTVAIGQWVHLCAVYNLSAVTLYIDGISNIYTAVSGTGVQKDTDYIFGEGLRGDLRQVRIFNRALNTDEITAWLMDSDLSDEDYKKSLAAYYDFSQLPAAERIESRNITLNNTAEQRLFSSGAVFSGNSFLSIDKEPNINPAGQYNDSYTVQAWVFMKPNEFADRQTIFANGDVNGVAGMSLLIDHEEDTYHVKALRGSGPQEDTVVVSADPVEPYRWINVAVTYGIDTMNLYVDGKLSGTATGLFPIPDRLLFPQPRIGSEVVENDENGQDWFTGCISRLDIWGKALSADEIVKYAGGSPEPDAEGLFASYALHQRDTGNCCTGMLLGDRNDLTFGEVSVKAPKNFVFNEARTLDSNMGGEPLQPRQLSQFRAQALEKRAGVDGQPFFYTVTSHVLEDTVYFVAHDRDSSYTVCYGSADDLDVVTQWYIDLLLIIIGGVMSVIFGVKLSGSNTRLLEILKSVVRNPSILTAPGQNISWKFIVEIFRILFFSGRLVDVIRAGLTGLSFWKVVYIVAKTVALAAASAVGGWAYYAVALAVVVADISAHMTEYPGPQTQTLGLSAIKFRHDGSKNITVALQYRDLKNNPMGNPVQIKSPEWKSDKTDLGHAAYRLDTLGKNKVVVQASFRCTSKYSFTKEVRCVNIAGEKIFGDSDTVTVQMKGGESSPKYVNFTFDSNKLAAAGIRYAETVFSWQEKNSDGVWQEIARTKHTIYVILTQPQLPWNTSKHLPWINVLKYTCKWAAGATTKEQLAEKIVTYVNGSLGLWYDKNEGNPSFLDENEDGDDCFLLSLFLHVLESGEYTKQVNCIDCAMVCSTFANAAGCSLSQKRMSQSFKCNKIMLIGYKTWTIPGDGTFNYHEVCMMEPLQETPRPVKEIAENNYYIYDACLKLDGSTNPDSDTGRDPYLSTGMHFSEFKDDTQPVSIPKRASYREHLATNDADGRGKCKYEHLHNNYIEYQYKDIF